MRSCCILRILPLALMFTAGLSVPFGGDRTEKQDLPLLRKEDLQNSQDYGLDNADILLNAIGRILSRLESSAEPPFDNNINSDSETSWSPLANDLLSSEHSAGYLPKPSTNGLILSLTSFQKRQAAASCLDFMCRMVRGRNRVNANAGARSLPFGKRTAGDTRNSGAEDGLRSVRGMRRGRGRPRARGGAAHNHPAQQNKLPFGKRHYL